MPQPASKLMLIMMRIVITFSLFFVALHFVMSGSTYLPASKLSDYILAVGIITQNCHPPAVA